MGGHELHADCWCAPVVEGAVVKHNMADQGDKPK